MRVLHSIVLDGWSAGSWYAVNVACHLDRLGHENLLICRPGCRTQREAAQVGLRFHDRINLEAKNPLRMVTNLSALRRILAAWKPDIVCAHWGEDHSYWGVLKLLYHDGVPLVRVRSLDPKPPKAHVLSRWLHKKQTKLVVVSNAYLRRCYLELFDLPEESVKIVPAGLDIAGFADPSPSTGGASGFKAGNPTVGLVARFSPVKGHSVFFRAARLVAEKLPEVRFVLAGFESELKTKDLMEMARKAGVDRQIEIIDRRTGSPAAIIARFDVGVVSSVYSESVSRVLLEYLATGVPVVAANVGGIPDLLSAGEFGILVPPGSAEELAAGIVELLRDHERRRRLGCGGREFIRTHRTWEESARNFAAALSQAVKSGSASGSVLQGQRSSS